MRRPFYRFFTALFPQFSASANRGAIHSREFIKRLPVLRHMAREIEALRQELATWKTWKPPGHFYSPIPCQEEVRAAEEGIFAHDKEILGVDLNQEQQLVLLDELGKHYGDLPFDAHKSRVRYFYENEYYSYADAIVLYSMLRHLRPRRIIEVGSGFSSAVILDTNELFLGNQLHCTFIEPDIARLRELMRDQDAHAARVLPKRVQEVPIEEFAQLRAGDFLIVDSSHVSKTGSDLNKILFEVLPRLECGVYIHFHDIFFPFEYPKEWVYHGVAWNEVYLLRAFLQYNTEFEIVLFTSYLIAVHGDHVARRMPLMFRSEKEDPTLHDAPGSSLWIRKGQVRRGGSSTRA